MVPRHERAYTCKLPTRRRASSLRLNCPDWSKIDIIGQTIILVELARRLGSFRNACAALKLQSNEVVSFLRTHLEYQQASERGKLIAEQWGRDQAVPANDEDIPQQRPVLVCLSSIAPACNFLEVMGFHEHIPAVKAWSRRTLIWPPDIDKIGFDTSGLDQADIVFPTAQKQKAYAKYTTSLGNDSRAVVGFVGSWYPKEDGSPDTRIAFIDVPDGSVAYGPRGSRQLINSGRYYVCWRVGSLADSAYNDFVLAMNTAIPNLWNCRDAIDSSVPGPEVGDSTVNPKAIFGAPMSDAYNPDSVLPGPFHAIDEPHGPSRKLANPRLQQTWRNWPGKIFQFRLHRGYTMEGPRGHKVTLDPPQHERYDEMGNPRGIGGTYYIVPFEITRRAMAFKVDDLPADVSFRFKTTERLVFIRNGMVLPRFVEAGVHEWSTREGHLNFYNAHGCYDIQQVEGRYNILPGANRDPSMLNEEAIEREGTFAVNQPPFEEAFKVLAPHEESFPGQGAKTKQLEREIESRARLDARNAREEARRDMILEERRSRQQVLEVREAREQAGANASIYNDTPASESVQNRREKRRQSYDDQFDPKLGDPPPAGSQYGGIQQQEHQSIDSPATATLDVTVQEKTTPRRGRPAGATRRKRLDEEKDGDYKPATSRPGRGRKPKSAQNETMPKNSRKWHAGNANEAEDSRSASLPRKRRTRAARSQIQPENSGPGSAHTGIDQSSSALTGAYPPRTAPMRKPIGPLLDAIRANPIIEGSGKPALHLSTVPDVGAREIPAGAANDSGAVGENSTGRCRVVAMTTSVPQPSSGHDEEETEYEVDL